MSTSRYGLLAPQTRSIRQCRRDYDTPGIRKDTNTPYIGYDSPVQVGRFAPPEQNYIVNMSTVTLSGKAYDASSIRKVRITHKYTNTGVTID
jgi:hypothetical protein